MIGQRARHWGAVLAASAGLLLAGAGALAEEVRDFATVEARSVEKMTLTLDGNLYRVTPSTTIEDRHGNRLALAEVPVAPRRNGRPEFTPETAAEFVAEVQGSRRTLHWLKVGAQLPQ